MGLIFLAIFFALATTNFTPSFFNQSQQVPMNLNKDCSYEAVSPASQKVTTDDASIESVTRTIRVPNLTPPPPSPLPPPPSQEVLSDAYAKVYADPSKNWVLVKKGAWLPNFKLTGGAYGSSVYREMDILQQVNENGTNKWAFIGLGHCKIHLGSDEGCWDPLTTVTIYVLQTKGNDTTPPIYPQVAGVPDSSDKGFWVFNVYIREDILITNRRGPDYSSNDLPCWISQCLGGDLRDKIRNATQPPAPSPTYPPYAANDWNRACPGASAPPRPAPQQTLVLGEPLAPGEDYPPSFLRKEWVDPVDAYNNRWGAVPNLAFFVGKLNDPGFTPDNSLVNYRTFSGKLGTNDIIYDVSIKKLGTAAFNDIGYLLKPQGRNIYYLYLLVNSPGAATSQSLKLGTFSVEPGFVYEWWYPSCKPVVYFYPEKQTSFTVTLKPFGILTKSIPSYPWFGGWKNVLAEPDGKLTYKGENYDYLYYEGKAFYVKVPQSGFVVKGYELADFFDAILPKLGLIDKEIADFKQYWLARLNEPERFYFIGILPQEEIERVEPMELNPKPDTLIRVRLFFKKLENPQLFALPQIPQTPVRKGTTVVDWGGFYKE